MHVRKGRVWLQVSVFFFVVVFNNFRRFGERQMEVMINWRERVETTSERHNMTKPQQGRWRIMYKREGREWKTEKESSVGCDGWSWEAEKGEGGIHLHHLPLYETLLCCSIACETGAHMVVCVSHAMYQVFENQWGGADWLYAVVPVGGVLALSHSLFHFSLSTLTLSLLLAVFKVTAKTVKVWTVHDTESLGVSQHFNTSRFASSQRMNG